MGINKRFKVIISILLMCVMCSFSVSAAPKSGYTLSADDFPGMEVSQDTQISDQFIPIDVNEQTSITLSDDKMPRNQMGEPMDQMYFYQMYLYPIVKIPDTGEIGIWNYPIAGAYHETRQYFSVDHSSAATTKMYQDVIAQGVDMLGWQVKVKFRFDFITPVSWTRMHDYQNPIEENVPQPHNAYQTYIYTFNSYFQKNPLEQYSVSFSGDVLHFDKYDKKTEHVPFNASVNFNVN